MVAAGVSGAGGSASTAGFKSAVAMVAVQAVLSGNIILYKLAVSDGMDIRVLVAYRFLFATVFLAPLAFFMERSKRQKMTMKIFIGTFCSGFFGGTLAQNLYAESMKMTSATFATALINLIPATTFILAVLFRLEVLEIRKASGKAKVLGTVVGVAGAMILTFYKGPEINLWSTNINLLKTQMNPSSVPQKEVQKRIFGAVLAFGSCLSFSTWMIIQAKLSKIYPCLYSSTALMCLMASIQTTIIALCTDRKWSNWRLGIDVRLLTCAYSGIMSSGVVFLVLSWCIQNKGPLYASVFNPLAFVIVALLGSILLQEKLHAGSIVGAALIVIGLYMVLLGKGREAADRKKELPPYKYEDEDPMELFSPRMSSV